jgi:hypothetical protein
MTSLATLDEPSAIDAIAPTHSDTHVHAAAIAACVAAIQCVGIAIAGWQIAPEGWVAGIVGLPSTTFLAWRMGPGVAAAGRDGAVGRAVGLSIATILLTDALVVAILLLGSGAGFTGSWIGPGTGDPLTAIVNGVGLGIVLYFYGALIVGIPAAVIVVPAALVWAAIVRRLVRHQA